MTHFITPHTASPFDADALSRSVPRYTSYPTAPHFDGDFSSDTYECWLRALPPDAAISLYLHIPFCDTLCWFCACRTQGSKVYYPVTRYLAQIEREIARVAELTGGGQAVTQMHWGGGSPTVLAPGDIRRLARHVREHFPNAKDAEFAVEIDPRDMTPERVAAFADTGLTRASIGVQDFDDVVQQAIGRHQGYELTRDVVAALRGIGVSGVNMDLLYGLPHQTEASIARTIGKVIDIGPDRIALFGYAHVPWMSKRQKMIDSAALPGPSERQNQAALAAHMLTEAGYTAIGIDHFARPGDSLASARDDGTLRRNFQGYTADRAEALIGFGASAIGFLPQGYVQNDPATATYQLRVEQGGLAARRGCALDLDDRIRRDAIEEILCQFRLDLDRLHARYGDFTDPLRETVSRLLAAAPAGALTPWRGGFTIADDWHSHTRLIAAEFDAYFQTQPARHSLAV
ncbi:MAG TPA: oxygen-independent coproporphyrinogen III oxidase [Thermohalobaculum sp.]|nr:oxygen-independent coproporphyrinogen III oxidase [Thermohalobaculum sp.]